MKAEITFTGQQARMTHKQIAELVNSRPDNVKVSIERLAERGVIRLPVMQEIEKINNLGLPVKREYYCFEGEQGKRDSIVVVAQLSPEFTAQLVDRWQALEKAVEFIRITKRKPAQLESVISPDLASLARVVAEATAFAMMKVTMEAGNTQARVTDNATSRTETTEATPEPEDSEFIPIVKLTWSAGISDTACRRLAKLASLPVRKIQGIRGLPRSLPHKWDTPAHRWSTAFTEAGCPKAAPDRWHY